MALTPVNYEGKFSQIDRRSFETGDEYVVTVRLDGMIASKENKSPKEAAEKAVDKLTEIIDYLHKAREELNDFANE